MCCCEFLHGKNYCCHFYHRQKCGCTNRKGARNRSSTPPPETPQRSVSLCGSPPIGWPAQGRPNRNPTVGLSVRRFNGEQGQQFPSFPSVIDIAVMSCNDRDAEQYEKRQKSVPLFTVKSPDEWVRSPHPGHVRLLCDFCAKIKQRLRAVHTEPAAV